MTILPFRTEPSAQRPNKFNTNIACLPNKHTHKICEVKKNYRSFLCKSQALPPTGWKSFRRIIIVKIGMNRLYIRCGRSLRFPNESTSAFQGIKLLCRIFSISSPLLILNFNFIGFLTWQPIHQLHRALWIRIKLSVRLQFTLKF